MWPFTRTLSERYSKLVKLIKSIDSHFQLTEDKEDSLRLHLPNYKGNQTMDFHIYLMEPFLCINYVTEIDGEKISTVNRYPHDMDQQDMFNAVMASNLDRIHEVIEGTIQEENEENKGLNDEQLYALYYYAELCYYSCTKKGDAAHSTLFNLFLSRLNLSDEDILQLKAYHSSVKPEELYTALRSIDDKELFDIFISMCIVFVDDADTYITEKEFDNMLQAIGLTIDDVRSIMARRGLASIKHYYDRERTTAWDDVDEKDDGVNRWIDEEENKALRIINVWSLLVFAKAHGKMQVGEFANKDTGEVFKACIFTKPDDGTRTFVAFSTKLGELTPKQIADMKNELQVVQLESGNYSLCKIDSGWKDVDLEERLAAEAHEQRASQNDSAINAVPSQSELVRKAKGILSNREEIGIDTIFKSKDFIKGRKLKVKSLTAKFSIADIEESYMEGSQWRSKLGYYNISQDTQYHVSDIRTIEYDREKDILKLNFIQIVNNKYDSIWFSRKFDRISIEFYRHHALMMEQKSRFDKACLPLEDLFYAFCSLSQFDGKDAIVTLSGGAYQADCFQNYYNDSQVRYFKELVDVRYVYEELDEIVRGTTTADYYMKQHGMTREEYFKENFNEVNTLTACCLRNKIDAYVHEDYSELEVGKMYKVTHIGVFRSFTRIMLEGFGDKEYNSVCFELFENGESIDKKYTREHRFLAPYLRKLKKIE